MKKLLIISIMSVFSALFLFVPTGFSYVIDREVDDLGVNLTASGADEAGYLDKSANAPSGGNDIDYFTEDNADYKSWYEVGPGWSQGNLYDAEAVYFDNDGTHGYIAIITGTRSDAPFKPGDIAIDVGDGGEYGYEYGIGLNGLFYNVSHWNNVFYPSYAEANPWTIYSGTEIETTGTNLVYSSILNDHYVIEAQFLLSDLGLVVGDTFNIHWTMECGNDVLDLKADINPVPEPSTMLLLGFGLIGLGGIGRSRTRLLKRNQREEDKG